MFDARPFLPPSLVKPKTVVVCGMGGSSLPFDLVKNYVANQFQIQIVRAYSLPETVLSDDLVICTSYSGNTEETILCFKQAMDRKIPVVVMAHGGELYDLAKKNNVPLVSIPDCIQPRCAIGYFFTSALALLEKAGLLLPQNQILKNLSQFLEKRKSYHDATGQKTASLLKEKVPLIYSPVGLEGVSRIWKVKINENAKVQAFYNVFPELNHNEMVGFTRLLMSPVIVLLKSKFMNSRINRRMDVMREMLEDRIPFVSFDLEGGSLLEEIFEAHALADYTSYYLAKLYGVDPAPVKLVEDFKKRLG